MRAYRYQVLHDCEANVETRDQRHTWSAEKCQRRCGMIMIMTIAIVIFLFLIFLIRLRLPLKPLDQELDEKAEQLVADGDNFEGDEQQYQDRVKVNLIVLGFLPMWLVVLFCACCPEKKNKDAKIDATEPLVLVDYDVVKRRNSKYAAWLHNILAEKEAINKKEAAKKRLEDGKQNEVGEELDEEKG